MIEIGTKVFYVDIKAKAIIECYVIAAGVSSSGYLQYTLKNCVGEPKQARADFALVFENKEDAEQKMPFILELEEHMTKEIKEFDEKLTLERESLLGKPTLKYLLEQNNG